MASSSDGSGAVLQPDDGGESSNAVSVLGNGGAPSFSSSSIPGELRGGGMMDRSASYQLTPSTGEGGDGGDSMTREKSHHTLAELKRQRVAAKLQKRPAPAPPLPVREDPALHLPDHQGEPSTSEQEITHNTVFFTPASGDPPLLKLRAPEEETPNTKEPCCGLM